MSGSDRSATAGRFIRAAALVSIRKRAITARRQHAGAAGVQSTLYLTTPDQRTTKPQPLLAGLRKLGALDPRVHAQVVERPGQDRHDDRARPGATGVSGTEVAALARRKGADEEPHQHQDGCDAARS